MADIKQAARWMKEGKQVIDGNGFRFKTDYDNDLIIIGEGDAWEPANMYASDILSEDWEIAAD
jgi:hypothetical protein